MILLDATPIVALCDSGDGLHAGALRDLNRVARESLVLCLPVLTKATFLLRPPVHRARLRDFLQEFSVVAYRADDELSLWLDHFRWLARYETHDPDWTDGYLAVVSGRERRFKVWTYDREFRSIWRRLDGTRIPLAVA